MILENWTNGSWENRMQQLPSYDKEGRLTKNEIAHWNPVLKVWEDQTKTVFSRDENGNVLTRETFKWFQDQSSWKATIRTSYSMTEHNERSSVLNEIRNEEGWYNQSIEEYKYDVDGNLIEKRSERWDKQLISWVPDRKFDYTIESDRMVGYSIYFWDNQVEEWQSYKKTTYHYSNLETIDYVLVETWIDGNWKEHSIRRNFHDEKGVLSTMEVEIFDQTSNIWQKANHVEYEFTGFSKVSESISKKWNGELNKWDNLQRSTYSYSKDGEVIEEWSQVKTPMELFPNPAVESLTIRSIPGGTILIVDALGKIVLQTENKDQDEMKLDVSKWEIGVYSIQVNGNEIQKFVKQ